MTDEQQLRLWLSLALMARDHARQLRREAERWPRLAPHLRFEAHWAYVAALDFLKKARKHYRRKEVAYAVAAE